MKKYIIFGFAATVLLGCGTSTNVRKEDTMSVKVTEKVESKYTGPRRRVAVVDFENKSKYGARIGASASDILLTELGKSGKFILVERQKLGKIIDEQKLGQAGIVDPNTAAQVGRVLGLNAIITGSLEVGVDTVSSGMLITAGKKQTARAIVDIRVVDVSTGRILYTDSGTGIAEKSTGTFLGMGTHSGYDEKLEGEALRAAIVKFTDNIISQINKAPWSCRIAEVDGKKVYLDAGRESGLVKGQKLTVYSLGKEIISPTTGLVIGVVETKAGTIEVEDYFGEDGSTALINEGSLKKGDLCKINE